MDCRPGKKRTMNVDMVDRLSSLPDDLIHKILSLIDIKDAINTSTCSSRWRFIWTLMPYLNISSEHFSDSNKFSEFVTHVLSQRNNQIEVFSLKLTLSFKDLVSKVFLTKIFDYAFSHNVQELTLSCVFKGKIKFPLGLFRSQSLKYLRLTGPTCEYSSASCLQYSSLLESNWESTWELPALTTLHLDMVKLYDDDTRLFSMCPNLNNLILTHFRKKDSDIRCLSISHPQILSLTLEDGRENVDVVAPQLKHLRIRESFGQHRIFAPNLVSLFYKSYKLLQFSNDDLNSLEKVYFCLSQPQSYYADEFVGLLQRFHNVKFLTLNLELVELLSSNLKSISLKSSPFANLKSIKIYPDRVSEKAEEGERPLTIAGELKIFLLDSSPSATFTIVSREKELKLQFNFNTRLCSWLQEFNVFVDMSQRDGVGPSFGYERLNEYDGWTSYQRSMWDMTASQGMQMRSHELALAYAHEQTKRQQFEYFERVRHHQDYLAGLDYVETPPLYDYSQPSQLPPHPAYPQSYDSEWFPRHSCVGRVEGTLNAPPSATPSAPDPFDGRSLYQSMMESIFGPQGPPQ